MQVGSSKLRIRYLKEAQNASFDAEYHSQEELADKLRVLERIVGSELRFLDVGGGNGKFTDAILDHFPASRGTIVDISKHLLSLNRRNDRKTLIECDILKDDFFEQDLGQFDVIFINWVLHHLVTDGYSRSGDLAALALNRLTPLLSENGVIVVAENMVQGFFGTNLPSRLIYGITSVRHPAATPITSKFFNTAGTGVCFRSERAWKELFADTSLTIREEHYGEIHQLGVVHRLLYPLLFLRHLQNKHFFMTRERCSHA